MSNSTTIFEEKTVGDKNHNSSGDNIVQCNHCKEKFALAQGTILFDGDWYHETCWEFFEKEMTP